MVVAIDLLAVLLSGGIDVSFMSVALFGGYVSMLLMMQKGIDNIAFPFIRFHADWHRPWPAQCAACPLAECWPSSLRWAPRTSSMVL